MKRVAALAVFLNLLAAPALCATGSITGIVRSRTTGEPVPRAAVTLRFVGGSTNLTRTSVAGTGGEFHFSDAPPGKYRLLVRKSGYRAASGSAELVTLRDGEERSGVLVDLWPAGSISGTVTGPGDEPLPGAEVRAYGVMHQESGIALPLAGQAESDDLGEYRIFGLDAGRYILWAGPPRGATPTAHYYADAGGAYYPGTVRPSQALPLDLGWGQQLERIGLKPAENPGFSIGGVVADAAREGPCSGCSVRAIQVDGEMRIALPGISTVARDGRFLLHGLAPGEYKLLAWRGGGDKTIGQAGVLLRDRAIADAGILAGASQTVSGEIVIEEAPEGMTARPWTPRLTPLELPESWPSVSGETGEDLRFEIGSVPPAAYRFELLKLPEGAYLKALTSGSRPLPSPVVAVGPASPLSGLRAVVAFDGGSVQGHVEADRQSDGAEAPPAEVYLFPEEGSNAYLHARRTVVAPGGQFRFGSVPPGSYRLCALPRGSARQIFDPAVRGALRGHERAVEVSGREAVDVAIALPPGRD